MFVKFMILLFIHIIEALCIFAAAEQRENAPEKKRYSAFLAISIIVMAVTAISGLFILRP